MVERKLAGKMILGSAVVLFFGFTLAYGTPCTDLTGVWRNELGSNMSIVHVYGNSLKISGQYNTSVESSKGASTLSSPISGLVQPTDGGSLVSFSVLWNKGASITTWTGQCLVCDGKEILFTTWVLRSRTTPIKKWMTTRINQDTFWRIEGEHSRSQEIIVIPPEDLLGTWTSISGDYFNITYLNSSGVLEGDLLSPTKENLPPVSMFGTFDGNETYTALAFSAADDSKIRGWTAHIYNPEGDNKIIESSWLAHTFSDCCNNPRKFVNYGMDNYTKEQEAAPAA